MEEYKIFQVALQLLPGIGNANAKYLFSYLGNPEKIFSANKSQLLKVPGIGESFIKKINAKNTLEEAKDIVKSCEKRGIHIIHYTEKEYPDFLKSILDAPNVLYFKGNGDLNPKHSLSIVGTRDATEYGKEITSKIIAGVKPIKPTIFSGLAYGIDIQSHRESLSQGLPTIAVIAGGIDMIYPKQHYGTARKMMENKGGILTEHPPGKIPEAHLFPARNRIIAGISEATLVVEAAKKGGALITADLAHSYNRPVFSVPGNLDQPFSVGCNSLIQQQKALIYTQPEDIFYHLNWDLNFSGSKGKNKRKIAFELSDHEKRIIDALSNHDGVLPIDELAWKSQIQINELASLLLNLEFKGVVKSLPGKKYRLC